MSKLSGNKPETKWWHKSLMGLAIIVASVWVGAYALHVVGGMFSWAYFPIWFTGFLMVLIGIVIAMPSEIW